VFPKIRTVVKYKKEVVVREVTPGWVVPVIGVMGVFSLASIVVAVYGCLKT